MTLLLTGAGGFTGRHFVESARQAGLQVHALQADLRDREAVAREVLQVAPRQVVHLAAISHVAHADERAFYDVNVFGSLGLLDALAQLPAPPEKVLLASSANVYGNAKESPLSERRCPDPANHYGVSKYAMEQLARNYGPRLPIVISRPFNYTGPGQHVSFLIPKLVDHFARRAPVLELGNQDVEREFNDVRFVCDAYLLLLRQGLAGEVYNVCSGRPATLRSVIELLQDMTGHRIEIRTNPAFVRANEIKSLCGDPAKLQSLQGTLRLPELRETLGWMLRDWRPAPA